MESVLNSSVPIRPPLMKVVVGEDGLLVGEQIRKALDGRSQRWLALRIMMAEADLSRKLHGKFAFTIDELKNIARALNIEFCIGPDGKPPVLLS